MSEQMKHSETPWNTTDMSSTKTGLVQFEVIRDVDNNELARIDYNLIDASTLGHKHGEANAAHIVRCVNAHDDLVKALQGARLMLYAWKESRPKEYGVHKELEETIFEINAALKAQAGA